VSLVVDESAAAAAAWNAKEFACTGCHRVISFEARLPGLRCALCPHCHQPLRSAEGRALDALRDLLSSCKQWRQATESRLRHLNSRNEAVALPVDQALFDAIDRAEGKT
jgi:hypothetical protein